MLSIEDGYDSQKANLRSVLRDTYRTIWAVHRLDMDTSGVIIFAKNEESHRELNSSFSNREVLKNYRGIVYGFPIWDSFEIKLPLRINGDRKHRTVVDLKKGKTAFTQLIKLQSNNGFSYIDIFPKTGLTHQIRAHLSAIGFPIFGDYLYWRCCKLNIISKIPQKNFFLHAMSLNFAHPISKKPMFIYASLPFLFTEMLGNLELNC